MYNKENKIRVARDIFQIVQRFGNLRLQQGREIPVSLAAHVSSTRQYSCFSLSENAAFTIRTVSSKTWDWLVNSFMKNKKSQQ